MPLERPSDFSNAPARTKAGTCVRKVCCQSRVRKSAHDPPACSIERAIVSQARRRATAASAMNGDTRRLSTNSVGGGASDADPSGRARAVHGEFGPAGVCEPLHACGSLQLAPPGSATQRQAARTERILDGGVCQREHKCAARRFPTRGLHQRITTACRPLSDWMGAPLCAADCTRRRLSTKSEFRPLLCSLLLSLLAIRQDEPRNREGMRWQPQYASSFAFVGSL
jgi:hypothetical protein